MFGNRCYSHQAGRRGACEKEGMDRWATSRDRELIHSLHQSLDLCREAMGKSGPWGHTLIHILDILRKLLDAPVAVVRLDCLTETFFHVSTGNPASEGWLASDRHFVRLCEYLIAAPQPMLIGDALEESEFADPYLRCHFPKLSFLTISWPLPGGDIVFAFFSHLPGHFRTDQITLLERFGSLVVGAPYADLEQHALCMA